MNRSLTIVIGILLVLITADILSSNQIWRRRRAQRDPRVIVPSRGGPHVNADCSKNVGHCREVAISGDAPARGKFHGYADPSMRKDPNSSRLYMAYSWPNVLNDDTIDVEIHLAYSDDRGDSWKSVGTMFSAEPVTNRGSGKYAESNYKSVEVIDLLPIKRGNSILWVQASMGYLVRRGERRKIYDQLHETSYISVSAIPVSPNHSPSELLRLTSAREARLGNKGTDATLNPSQNLSALDSRVRNCTNLTQPALYYENDVLYLALQCLQKRPSGDGAAASHFMFSTNPSGSDASQWRWGYVGEFATPREATALGTVEGTTYNFFTEVQFMRGANGQDLALMNPVALDRGGIQPIKQYGCRVIPMLSFSRPALKTDSAGVPGVVASVGSSDLYSGRNQGTGACTYEASSKTGIVLVRKLSADPALGFFVSLMASGLNP